MRKLRVIEISISALTAFIAVLIEHSISRQSDITAAVDRAIALHGNITNDDSFEKVEQAGYIISTSGAYVSELQNNEASTTFALGEVGSLNLAKDLIDRMFDINYQLFNVITEASYLYQCGEFHEIYYEGKSEILQNFLSHIPFMDTGPLCDRDTIRRMSGGDLSKVFYMNREKIYCDDEFRNIFPYAEDGEILQGPLFSLEMLVFDYLKWDFEGEWKIFLSKENYESSIEDGTITESDTDFAIVRLDRDVCDV